MNRRATLRFWDCYGRLPGDVQDLADRCYETLRNDPRHPSLRLKKAGVYWSVRVGGHYRALAAEVPDGVLWVWVRIGTHAEYDHLLRG